MAEGDVQELRNRHFAIMDAMLAHPEMQDQELAKLLHYSPSRFSVVKNSSLFQMAFREYRRKFEAKLSDQIAEATASAIKFSQEVVETTDIPVSIRQVSARDILAQGHAKAVERKASLHIEAEVPKEVFTNLEVVMKELGADFKPTKLLERPEEVADETEARTEG